MKALKHSYSIVRKKMKFYEGNHESDRELFVFWMTSRREDVEDKNREDKSDLHISIWLRLVSFYGNKRKLWSLLILSFFYLGCSFVQDITEAVATITAVIIAGCVSFYVIQDSQRLEHVKLVEKWVYELRESVADLIGDIEEYLEACLSDCRLALGLHPTFYDVKNDYVAFKINSEDALSIKAVVSRADMVAKRNLLTRKFGRIKFMLAASDRSKRQRVHLLMFEMIILHSEYLACRSHPPDTCRALKSMSIANIWGKSELENTFLPFFTNELDKGKSGNRNYRDNTNWIRFVLVWTILLFVVYTLVSTMVHPGYHVPILNVMKDNYFFLKEV